MKREKIRRASFIGAACLLSFPWLTPCVGIWSAAAVNGVHDSATKRDEPLNRLPDAKLRQWAAKLLPRIAVFEHQNIPKSLLVTGGNSFHDVQIVKLKLHVYSLHPISLTVSSCACKEIDDPLQSKMQNPDD